MLISLRFQNIALFGNLENNFHNGFTAFTGPTGSGKSIFIDTINALLANKNNSTDNRLVSNGSSFAFIEGAFSVLPSIKNWLVNQEFDVDDDDDLIVSREWRLKENKYKSRFRINGILVNREQISQLRSLLLDFTLQGDSHTLSDSSYQLNLLDSLGSDEIKESIINVNKEWKNWTNYNFKLKNAQDQISSSEQEFKEMQDILKDLEKLELDDPSEDIKLESDQNRLSNLLRLQQGVHSLLLRLDESRNEYPSLLDHTNFCITELKTLSNLDSSLRPLLDNLSKVTNDFYDLICQIKDYEKTLNVDPSSLNDVQLRLSTLKLFQKKYCRSIPDLISFKDELYNNLSLHNNNNNINELYNSEQIQRLKRDKRNKELSTLRKMVAKKFEHKLIISMKELGIPNVRFQVQFEECEPNVNGIDKVNFLFSANPGVPLAPLSQIASGGEKSRVLLAIKAIFASFDQTNLLIFDEIDSGVSGTVSGCVAKMLSKLSIHRQVFCVTHQPLIAAFADNHFAFKKIILDGTTKSTISNLKEITDRQKELALLAGGEFVEANAYAASLLEHKAA